MEGAETLDTETTKDKKPRKRMKALYGRIKQQMEFYFSDSNLNRDRFMKKQIVDAEDGCKEFFLEIVNDTRRGVKIHCHDCWN
ncbi:hypothetical protein AM593_00180, partial [Mytilus galloprovincialis]